MGDPFFYRSNSQSYSRTASATNVTDEAGPGPHENGLDDREIRFPLPRMDLKLVLCKFMAAHSGKVTQRRRPECLVDHLVTLQCIERNIQGTRQVADSGGDDRIGVHVADISMEGVAGIELAADTDAHLF